MSTLAHKTAGLRNWKTSLKRPSEFRYTQARIDCDKAEGGRLPIADELRELRKTGYYPEEACSYVSDARQNVWCADNPDVVNLADYRSKKESILLLCRTPK